jgi:DNA-binding IclR family transcriptional regulator
MARTGKPAVRHVAAVERSLLLLETLADAGGELGTNELARRTRVNPSSVSRLLATLAAGGYVDHDEDSGRYRLGVRLLQLGNVVLAGLDLRALAKPHLEALVDETGETATLSMPGEREAVTVDFVQSASSVQSVARVGRPSIAHATAAGKVLLAFGDVSLPSGRLERFTPKTITDPARLAATVEGVRQQGWAEAAGERERDLNAIAAPVFGAEGRLAGILGVQGPGERFDRQARSRAVDPLLAHGQTLSHALGSAP